MGDLVQLEDDGPGPPCPGGMRVCPSTSYQGLEVRDSSDVHVGNKYVAEQIVIVLPKDGEAPNLVNSQIFPGSPGAPWAVPKSEKNQQLKPKRFKFKLSVLIVSFAMGLGTSLLVVFAMAKNNTDDDGPTVTSFGGTTESLVMSTSSPQTRTTYHPASSKFPLSSTTVSSTVTQITHSTVPITIASTDAPLATTAIATVFATTVASVVCSTPGAESYPLVTSVVIVNVPRVAGDVCLVSRDQWGAVGAPCAACMPFTTKGPVLEVAVHFVDKCDSLPSCAGLVRRYESDYAQRYSTSGGGFLFNFVIGGDCRLYQGLGWDRLLAGDGAARVGLQLWSGQDDGEYRVSERQLYLLMLLVNVGRWCGRIGKGFAVSYVCTVKDCMRFFPVQRNIRFLAGDKYMMSDEAAFDLDSKALGAKFSACDDRQFQHFYSVCKDINNC